MNIKWNSEKSLLLSRCLTIATLALGIASLFCIPVITEWYDAISGEEPIHLLLNISYDGFVSQDEAEHEIMDAVTYSSFIET